MLLKTVILVVFLQCSLIQCDKNTFNDVTISGYSVYVKKFEKKIISSNNLKENLPTDKLYDKIELTHQNVPVLYENSIKNLEDLDELVIENCGLKEIEEGAIKNLPQLRRLSLKNNDLKEISNGVFSELQLSTLDLSENRITVIEADAFSNMIHLLNINLAFNEINKWNKNWFANTPLLTRISMQNNSISKIPNNAFKNLKGDRQYGSVSLTINLIFSYNKIEEISPKAFEDLEKINNLWLDNNLLTSFDDNLLQNTNVDDLRLNNNQIICFNGNFEKTFKANTTHIDGNPLDCQCLEKLMKWLEKSGKTVNMFYAKMNCDVERIKKKMTAVEARLKEIREEENGTENSLSE